MESTGSKIFLGVMLALVGAVASTVMGWIPNPFDGPEPREARTWLVIEGVDAFGTLRDAVKVTAHVNGTAFVYPSLGGVEWLEIGPSMSPQRFQLPRGMDRARVRFEMETRSGIRLRSQNTDVVAIPGGLPHRSSYNLHQVDGRTRAAPVSAAVRYALEGNP